MGIWVYQKPCFPALRHSVTETPAARRGLEAVRGSDRIYLEAYTSQLLVPKEQLVSILRGGQLIGSLAAAPFAACTQVSRRTSLRH